MRKDIKIVIGIPTINSKMYIGFTINKIKQEIKYCSNLIDSENIGIVISVNGDISSYDFIKKTYKNDNQIVVLFEEQTGKNNSLNQIINYAKINNIHIIHWFDDDVSIKEHTLKINLEQLIKNLENNSPPQIVASTILRTKRSLWFFIKNYGFLKGIIHFYYYLIFSLPFEETAITQIFV
ncbi:MAG: glycosyltransferase [Alphaproteobacteria bacterium]|nr:glycosyltransferase [Alphaproteobacteria bacterium]